MEKSGFAAIILSAVAILIGLALYSGTFAENIGKMTRTESSYVNTTYTMPAAGASLEITHCGQKIITGAITNATGGEVVPTTNYTFSTKAGADGYLASHVNYIAGLYASNSVNITCASYEPKGYVEDGGGRAIVGLIAVFMALLILIAALPDVRGWAADFLRGK